MMRAIEWALAAVVVLLASFIVGGVMVNHSTPPVPVGCVSTPTPSPTFQHSGEVKK